MEIFGEWIQQYRLKRCLTKLQDENPDVRREAIKILGEIGNPEAITHLIALLREWDWNVQNQAAETLGKIGVPAIMPLAKVLEEEDYSARSKALEILERIGGIHVVEPLIKALGDKDGNIRTKAASVLRRIGLPAIEPLIKALGNENEYVRTQAAVILEKMGTFALEPLVKALGDSQHDIRAGAAMTLGKIRDARAVEPLMRILEKDKNWFVRGEAAEALRKMKDPRARESFRKALVKDDHWYVRKIAVRFLAEAGDAHEAELFVIALKDEDSEVRKNAALALDKIGWRPSNDLEHTCYLAAKQQWDILSSLGARVIGALSGLLKDKNRDDREDLTDILEDICCSTEVIAFGSPDVLNNYFPPDVSELTLPMSLLKRIEIYTETYDFYQVERFITYAVNYIGQQHLKNHIEVHIYGDPDKLHPNLRNSLENLCKSVEVHEADS